MAYKKIPLTQGQVALVDAADYEWLSKFSWYANWGSRQKKYYARRYIKKSEGGPGTIYMHVQIMNPPPGLVVDHAKDGPRGGLDNRREHLRIVTQEENMARVEGWNRKKNDEAP